MKLTAIQHLIRGSTIVTGRGAETEYTANGRAMRLRGEARGSKRRAGEAKRLRKVRQQARDVAHLASMAAGSAANRAKRQSAFTGREIDFSAVAEMEAIYHAAYAAAYSKTGVVPSLALLFKRAKGYLSVIVAPEVAAALRRWKRPSPKAKLTVGQGQAAVMLAKADVWEARQGARDAAGEERERGAKVRVCVSLGERVNPYSAKVRVAWVRAVWRAAKGSIAEAYRGHRDIDKTISADELRGLQAWAGNEAAYAAESADCERVRLLNEESTEKALGAWGGGDRGARRVDLRRHLAHARRCLAAFHLDAGGQRWTLDLLKDYTRLSRLARIMRGESFALLGERGTWVEGKRQCHNDTATRREYDRFRARLGAGDMLLSGPRAETLDADIARWEAVRRGDRRARSVRMVLADAGWIADVTSIASAEGYALLAGSAARARAHATAAAALPALRADYRVWASAKQGIRPIGRPADVAAVAAVQPVAGLLAWTPEGADWSARNRVRVARRQAAEYRDLVIGPVAVAQMLEEIIWLDCQDWQASIDRSRRAVRLAQPVTLRAKRAPERTPRGLDNPYAPAAVVKGAAVPFID